MTYKSLSSLLDIKVGQYSEYFQYHERIEHLSCLPVGIVFSGVLVWLTALRAEPETRAYF